MEDLKGLIDECIANPAGDEDRKAVKEETWECYGEGAVRTAEYLINKREELLRKEDK